MNLTNYSVYLMIHSSIIRKRLRCGSLLTNGSPWKALLRESGVRQREGITSRALSKARLVDLDAFTWQL